MSSPTKLRQMAKELGWPPELEKAADQLQKLKRENAALKIELNRLRIALRDIADASTGQLTLPMWIRGKVAATLGKEAQP